ncbi:PqqD family protein [Blautia wexlerae]|uniref:PqqD family protein n=1 Tax=Blautia wexlerae TaxID=418240 RepID=A0ABX2GN80_9FIRM|nr:PqqD family protein [Blautia wexlerae]NSF73105.1 PqqD family protein [Blautia wexlerae]
MAKVKDGFVLREVAGQAVVIAVGEASKSFHGMINLNETGRVIWQAVEQGLDVDAIAQKLVQDYEVDMELAHRDAVSMLEQMESAGILEK